MTEDEIRDAVFTSGKTCAYGGLIVFAGAVLIDHQMPWSGAVAIIMGLVALGIGVMSFFEARRL